MNSIISSIIIVTMCITIIMTVYVNAVHAGGSAASGALLIVQL